ncbi:rhomboid family intramembrane serine protease [Acaryochloris thomasi]|uniref:rhomboid family intramembrane serine protease n=1 Tax=Acaryochloris thomasi TaxID=2929456 RepID=UPI000DA68B70|nr:rhomboid family intramembrane serine protease [Acaryochloris thomasi]
MDLNRLLIWLVCISCTANLIRGLQHYRTAGGWVAVSGLILGLMWVLWLHQPQTAGLLGGAVWVIFVVLPLISFRRTQVLAAQYRFQAAARCAYFGRLFHPFDGWWIYPGYLRALALAQFGRPEAIGHFERLKNTTSGLGQAAYCNLFRVKGDWEGLRRWVEQDITLENLSRYPRLISFYLQALGETNALNAMVETMDRFQSLLQKMGQIDWNLGRLIVFTYCGQPAVVSHLLQGTRTPRDRRFWLATACMAAGKPEVAQADIDEILDSGDLLYYQTLQARTQWSRSKSDLSDRSHALLRQWRPDVDRAFPSVTTSASLKTSPVTLVLIGINLLFFLREIQGGSLDILFMLNSLRGISTPDQMLLAHQEMLIQLGALVKYETVINGEWSRVLTATFLHYDISHLLFNMLGLAILGPFVEKQLGRLRFSLMYFVAGVGSMLLVLQGLDPRGLALGASGAVMGVLGAEAVILLLQWRRKPSRFAQRRLRLIGIVVASQTVFDLITPEVSFIGHISGLVLGFVAGLILQIRRGT